MLAIASLCVHVAAQEAPGHSAEDEPIKIGIVHREIAESSPVVSATLSSKATSFQSGGSVKVHLVVRNTSDHEVPYVGPILVVEIHDASGNVSAETDFGCRRHWFSSCHYLKGVNRVPLGHGNLAPNGRLESDMELSDEYKFDRSGTYTAVGYVSGIKEGPEYFKTNSVNITIK